MKRRGWWKWSRPYNSLGTHIQVAFGGMSRLRACRNTARDERVGRNEVVWYHWGQEPHRRYPGT